VRLERYLGVALPPSRQKDAWSKRPVTAARSGGRRAAQAAGRQLIPLRVLRVAAWGGAVRLERWGGAMLGAVEQALALPEGALPTIPRRPRPMIPGAVSRRIEALRRWRAGATERIGLEPGVPLPNRLIGVIAAAGPRTLDALARVEGVRRWRVETLGARSLPPSGNDWRDNPGDDDAGLARIFDEAPRVAVLGA
jgi:ribonuclease D